MLRHVLSALVLAGALCSATATAAPATAARAPISAARVTFSDRVGAGPDELRAAYNLTAAAEQDHNQRVFILTNGVPREFESDVADYRDTYNLGVCDIANGCVQQLNSWGRIAPLPADVDGVDVTAQAEMVSAICPRCGITIISGPADQHFPAETELSTLQALKATYVITSAQAPAAQGDKLDGLLNRGVVYAVPSGTGFSTAPSWPAVSPYSVAVGVTSLHEASGTTRGWSDEASATSGSGCAAAENDVIGWQPPISGCINHRLLSDLSAVGDSDTGIGVATFEDGAWVQRSRAVMSAAIAAAAAALVPRPGGTQIPGEYIWQNERTNVLAFNDVTAGPSNGPCGAPLCDPGPGWDGPTGFGTLNGTVGLRPPDGGSGFAKLQWLHSLRDGSDDGCVAGQIADEPDAVVIAEYADCGKAGYDQRWRLQPVTVGAGTGRYTAYQIVLVRSDPDYDRCLTVQPHDASRPSSDNVLIDNCADSDLSSLWLLGVGDQVKSVQREADKEPVSVLTLAGDGSVQVQNSRFTPKSIKAYLDQQWDFVDV